MQQSIAKNATYLTTGYIAQKLLSFVYFVLVARFIGVEDLGKYTFALSFTTMFAVFVDFGMTNSFIREAAKYWEKAGKYLSSIISLKAILAIIVYAVVAVAVNLMGYPPITKNLVYLSGLIMVLDSFTLTFWGVFRGGQNLKYEAIGVIINQIIIVTVGATVLFMRLPLLFLMLPFLLGSLFNVIFSNLMIHKKLKIKFSFSWDKQILKTIMKIALPLALIAIFSRVYGYIDQVMLSYLSGDAFLGWYSTAMKIPFALQFIPSAFAAAVFPAFSYYYLHNKANLKQAFDRSMLALTILAVPLSFGIFSVAREAVLMIFGTEYVNSVMPLQILILGLIFVFLNFPLGALLNGCDKQVANTFLVGGTMTLNIILNLILIPQYTYVGAAIAFVICHGLLFFASLVVARQVIPYSRKYLLGVFIKTILSAGLMAAIIIYCKQFINFIPLIFIGAVIYVLILYILRGFTKQDLKFLARQFGKLKK